jgi:hypothetical protein
MYSTCSFWLKQVRTLEQEIESLRSSAAPKRFAFRRPTPQKVVQSTPSPLSAPAVLITAQSLPKALPDLASTHLSLSNQENTLLTLESLPAPLPAKSDLTISEIDSCVINLLPFSAESLEITALHVRNLKRTVLFAPFIKGSILLHDCVDCILVLGCHQVFGPPNVTWQDYTLIPSDFSYHSIECITPAILECISTSLLSRSSKGAITSNSALTFSLSQRPSRL